MPRERLLGIVGTLEPGIVLTDAAYADAAREAIEGTSLDVVELEGMLGTAADADAIAALRASALQIPPKPSSAPPVPTKPSARSPMNRRSDSS